MTDSSRDTTKSPKKRPEGAGEPVMVRLQPGLAKALDKWRKSQDDLPGRPAAIRLLVEAGLAVSAGKRNSKKS